ncbi:MAG: FkbM family methyltransferase [Planctomycetes bacterium]|nr:FkbM family methyltransferase [Planctomycetota bacterium]
MRFKYLMKTLLSPFTVRIRAGALQGRRWVIASGSRFVKGTYEPIQSEAFHRLIHPGSVVFDVGAHVGYYTVLSSVLAGPSGQVIAFEPLPANLKYLRRHLQLNACGNVRVLTNCVGEGSSTARFDDSHGTGVGHLATAGRLEVQVRSLDEMVESGELPIPQFIKIDVEGAELLVLRGAEQLLRRHHPTLVLSTHSDDLDRACLQRLSEFGYEVEHLEADVLVARVKLATAIAA